MAMKIVLYSVSSILVLAFSYLVFRYFVRKDYHEKGRTSWFSILLELLVFLFHAHLSYFFIPASWPNLPNFPANSEVQIIGLFFIGIGIIITLTAMISLGYKRTFGQGSDKINISGFYRYSRNPQIVAYGLAIVGFAMLWLSWYSLVWLI
jgi:protein-S-isoprenylcysteine O-methyltransferase Ste14